MGRERVRPHLRRLPAPRRAARRPLRAPAALPGRDRALHGLVARVRARRLAARARRRAGAPGCGRSGRLRGRALADHGALHGAGRPDEGDGRLRVRDGRRWEHRRAARRRPHRRARLALGLPRQPADRRRGRRAHARADPGRPQRDGAHAARRRRRAHGHGHADPRRLRDRERERGRLDVGAHARAARRRRPAARDLPGARVAGRLAARAAAALPDPERRDRQRRRRPLVGRDVRVVLPLGALPPARARIQPARGRARVPAREPAHGRVLARPLGQDRDALRDQAPAHRGHAAGRGRAGALRPRAGGRQLPGGRAAGDDRARDRRRDGVQPGAAGRDERRRASRSRASPRASSTRRS